MLKVAFVSMARFGGASRYLYVLVRALERTRLDPLILCWGDGTMAEMMRKMGVRTSVIPEAVGAMARVDKRVPFGRVGRKALWKLVALRRNLIVARLLREEKVDLIYLNRNHLFDLFPLVGVLAGRPVVTCVHNDRALGWRGNLLGFLSSRVVTVSEGVKRAFPAFSLVRFARKFRTIYYGIEHEAFNCPEAGLAVRRELGVGPEEFIVGIVGTLIPRKGHMVFLKMARRVSRDYPQVRFFVVGSGRKEFMDYEEQVRSFVHEHDLERVVQFLGWRDDIPAVMNALDLLVMPSFNEGLPLVILEATAAGKPVVATWVGGSSEAVVQDVTGLLVGPGDPDALTEAVRWMIEHPEKASEMGAAGRERVRTLFSPERMAGEFTELFEEVVGQGPASVRGRAGT